MNLLSMRFRNLAAQSKISDMAAPDIRWEQIVPLVAANLPQYLLKAIANRVDLNDLIAVWSLFYVDAVIRLKNDRGESLQVAIALRSQDNKAYSIYRLAQKPALVKLRHSLKIDCYWVFCVDEKLFPTREKWIELLNERVNRDAERRNFQLINL